MSAAGSKEEVQITSMIDLAGQMLKDEKKPLTFYEIFDRVAELKGLTDDEKEQKIAQFYTEMNVDGRFLNVGENMWGLKRWYPVERVEDELTGGTKKKAKKAKEAKKTKKAKVAAVEESPELDDELDIDVDEIDEVLDDDDLLLKEDDPFDDVELEEEEVDFDDDDDDDLELDEEK